MLFTTSYASPLLSKQVLEIGTASLRNFIELGKLWLDLDLSSYSLYLMPIGFLPSSVTATAISISNDEQNVVNYLAALMNRAHDTTVPDYHVSGDVNISFKRTSTADAAAVILSNDPNAIPVTVSEEDIRKRYPLGCCGSETKTEEQIHRLQGKPEVSCSQEKICCESSIHEYLLSWSWQSKKFP